MLHIQDSAFNSTPSRRENIKIAERKEQRSGSKTCHLCYRKRAVKHSFVHSGVKIVEEITIATAVLSSRFFSTDNSEKEARLPILQKFCFNTEPYQKQKLQETDPIC